MTKPVRFVIISHTTMGEIDVTTVTKQETAVEEIKRSSNFLRGSLSEELDSDVASVSNDAEQLLKFHGIYSRTTETFVASAPSITRNSTTSS